MKSQLCSREAGTGMIRLFVAILTKPTHTMSGTVNGSPRDCESAHHRRTDS